MRPIVATSLVLLLACGSEHPQAKQVSGGALLLDSIEAAPLDRVVVAEVNGSAVYADCVSTQASSHGLDRQAALQECIDFELLAQAANTPEYLADRRVQEEGKQELVRAFLDASYQLKGPETFDDQLVHLLWEKTNVPRYNHPPLRNIVSCRTGLNKGAGPDNLQAQNGKKFLEMLYGELKDRRDLKRDELFTHCHDRFKEHGVKDLKLVDFRLGPRESFEGALREPVFDGSAEPGQVLPPVLTYGGWMLVLMTDSKAALSTPFEQAEPELRKALYSLSVYQSQRDQLFDTWFKPMEARHTIERFPERLPTPAAILPMAEMEPAP